MASERPGGVDLDSFFGPVRVEWDHEATLTPLGIVALAVDQNIRVVDYRTAPA